MSSPLGGAGPEFTGNDTEVVPGVLRGYRSWRMNEFVPEALMACNFGSLWRPGVNEATCRYFPAEGESDVIQCTCGACRETQDRFPVGHMAPTAECTCGFYATHNPRGVDDRGPVVGAIKAYGKVILGTRGFRAQYAEIEALAGNWMPGIPEHYGVPAYNTMKGLLFDFPPIPVDELLPKEPQMEMYDWNRLNGPSASAFSAWPSINRGGITWPL